MTVHIDIDLGYEFHTPAVLTDVWALLSDLPRAAQHFPHLERLVDEGSDDTGGHTYRWELRPIGSEHFGLQTVYASQYRYTPPAAAANNHGQSARIDWTCVSGVGNAEIDGSWQIDSHAQDPLEGTRLALQVQGVLHLPVPSLMKPVVAPLVMKEFEQLLQQYIDNLLLHWAGDPSAEEDT